MQVPVGFFMVFLVLDRPDLIWLSSFIPPLSESFMPQPCLWVYGRQCFGIALTLCIWFWQVLFCLGLWRPILLRFPSSSPMVAYRSTLSWKGLSWMRWHVFCDFQSQLVFETPTGLAHFVSLTIIFPLRYGFLLFAFPVAHIPLFFGRLRMCSQTSFDCLAFMLCFLSLAFICLCPFINGFCPFSLCQSRAGLFSVIFLLRQLWLEWPNCCSTLFLAILLKYLAFPPCTCCDCLHYIVVYMFSFRIGQFFCLLCYFSPSVNFSYCPLLGHRFESSPFCLL